MGQHYEAVLQGEGVAIGQRSYKDSYRVMGGSTYSMNYNGL